MEHRPGARAQRYPVQPARRGGSPSGRNGLGGGTLRLRGPDHQCQQRVAANNRRLSQRGIRRHRPPRHQRQTGCGLTTDPLSSGFLGGFTRDLPRQYSGGGSATSTSTKTGDTFHRRCLQCDRRRNEAALGGRHTARSNTEIVPMSTRKGSTKPICIPITAIKEGTT